VNKGDSQIFEIVKPSFKPEIVAEVTNLSNGESLKIILGRKHWRDHLSIYHKESGMQLTTVKIDFFLTSTIQVEAGVDAAFIVLLVRYLFDQTG
jgi:hypothetical protein